MPDWTKAEIHHLMEIAGDMPRPRISSAYNQWAIANGYPRRSTKAIYVQAGRHGVSLIAVGAWLTTGGIARIIGVKGTTVEGWLHRFDDFPYSKFRNWHYVKRVDLRDWAHNHMHLFGGIPRGNLMQLFESESLADAIVDAYPNRPSGFECTAKPVQCIETGITYPSMSIAARRTYVSYQAMAAAIRANRPCCGLMWRYV